MLVCLNGALCRRLDDKIPPTKHFKVERSLNAVDSTNQRRPPPRLRPPRREPTPFGALASAVIRTVAEEPGW